MSSGYQSSNTLLIMGTTRFLSAIRRQHPSPVEARSRALVRRGGLIEPVARGFGVRQSRLFPRIEGGEIRYRITADPVAMHGSPSARTGSPRFSASENPLVV